MAMLVTSDAKTSVIPARAEKAMPWAQADGSRLRLTCARPGSGKAWSRFHHLPTMYTTVKTTTHTASTKCQYRASTLTRSACCGLELSRQTRMRVQDSIMSKPTITCEACKPTSE